MAQCIIIDSLKKKAEFVAFPSLHSTNFWTSQILFIFPVSVPARPLHSNYPLPLEWPEVLEIRFLKSVEWLSWPMTVIAGGGCVCGLLCVQESSCRNVVDTHQHCLPILLRGAGVCGSRPNHEWLPPLVNHVNWCWIVIPTVQWVSLNREVDMNRVIRQLGWRMDERLQVRFSFCASSSLY